MRLKIASAIQLHYSAFEVRPIFAKCAANVQRIFGNYVAFLCWKAAQTLLHEVSLMILSI